MNRIAAIALFVGTTLMTGNSAMGRGRYRHKIWKCSVHPCTHATTLIYKQELLTVELDYHQNPELCVNSTTRIEKAWDFGESIPLAREIATHWSFTRCLAISIT